MGKRLISRKDFAELCGVSAPAVTKACNNALQAACDGKRIDLDHPAAQKYVADKTRIEPEPAVTGLDGRYEEALAHCQKTGRWSATSIQQGLRVGYARAKKMYQVMESTDVVPDDPVPQPTAAPTPASPTPAADQHPDERFEIPEDMRVFADMTLRELIEKFGTGTRFKDWLDATQKIEAINEKRLKNAERDGTLVNRQRVKAGVIDRIDGVFVRMLSDGAKTIASRAHTMAHAGADVTEVRAMVEDQLGSFIRPAKVKMREAVAVNETN